VKIQTVEPEFKPVVLVLETQDDVDAMHAILGWVAEARSGVKVYQVYQKLCNLASASPAIEAKIAPEDMGLRLERNDA
jgi:hypothetical protein